MNKQEIAAVLEEIAMLLEIKGENPFRIRAYRNAAHALLASDQDLNQMIEEGTLTEIPGIGEDLAGKITSLAKKGRLPFYSQLKKSVPKKLLDVMQIHGLGGKKVSILYKKLGIKSVPELKKACLEHRIAKLKGFGPKTEQNILDALEQKSIYSKRHLWWDAMEIIAPILEEMRKLKGVKTIETGGSLRRKLETVGDIDLIASCTDPHLLMTWFLKQSFIKKVISRGDVKSSVLIQEGIQVDLLTTTPKEYPFALCYFTGSKEHSIELKKRALKQGLSLNEKGFVSVKSKKMLPSKGIHTEADIYKVLGLSYIPPEIRENQGELEAAAKGKIPKLVENEDIKGTFHNHTVASDGKNTLLEMAHMAEKLGWEYIGIADHSKSSFQANGLDEEAVYHQLKEIEKINKAKKVRPYIFSGIECDIKPDGKLDFSDTLLKHLDYVIISVHSALSQDEKTMTKRIIKAIEHPYSTILGHPTGRLLLERKPYAVNLNKVIDACIANGKIIEINSSPRRLDMDWRFWHQASSKGLKCIINTDAHRTEHLYYYTAGVNIARKGWLQKNDIINTLPLQKLKTFLSKMK